MSNFCQVAKKSFSFLESEFGYRIASETREPWGSEIVYLGAKTGIRLLYEDMVPFVFVFVCKLVDGRIVDNPQLITPESEPLCFDLNDFLDEKTKMKLATDYGPDSIYMDESDGMSNYVDAFSTRLRNYGQSFLNGDFSRLPEMQKLIRARAENLKD